MANQFGALLPRGEYLPLLLRVRPRRTIPGQAGDYFSEEQVRTWGLSSFWGLPEYPRTPYYRTWQAAIDPGRHLFEFVVPMVPPSWNDEATVRDYVNVLDQTDAPTAVALSVLDICQPATLQGDDASYYEHWCLTHFLLDGHHKVQAAADSDRPLRLLALVSFADGLAPPRSVSRLVEIRNQPERRRG